MPERPVPVPGKLADADDQAPPPLTADFTRVLPPGVLDDSTYSDIEDALDRAEAPVTAAVGRFLTLPERVEALARELGRGAPAMTKPATDADRWRQFLTSFGIEFREEKNGQEPGCTLVMEEGKQKISGYQGFYVDVEFDMDGRFVQIGAWE